MAVSANSTTLPLARRGVLSAFGLLATAPVALASAVRAGAPGPRQLRHIDWPRYSLEPAASPKIAMALADMKAADADAESVADRRATLRGRGAHDPDVQAAALAMDQAAERFADAVADMADAPATTAADLAAKAEGLRLALDADVFGGHAPANGLDAAPRDRLTRGLALDVLELLSAGEVA